MNDRRQLFDFLKERKAPLRLVTPILCPFSVPKLVDTKLRHTHATELVNDGVSLATIRKRLGHKNIQTTLRYAEQSDETADAELRAWRRHKMTAQ